MTTSTPRVSVVLPVYNAGALLRDAVESILDQTYRDFELIAVDDGSTDGSGLVLDDFAARDARVRVIHQENRKQVATMNRAIAEARGEYIARMDADDRSYPERLAKQVAFLDDHPEVGVLGTFTDVSFPDHDTVWDPDTEHVLLCWRLLSTTPMVHPSVTMRASVVRSVGGYSPGAERLEDYDLFYRLSRVTRLANLPERLVWYNRAQVTNISTVYFSDQQRVAQSVHRQILAEHRLVPRPDTLDNYTRLAFVGYETLREPGWTPTQIARVARLLWKLTARFVDSSGATRYERVVIWERAQSQLRTLAAAHARLTGRPHLSRIARHTWAPRLSGWSLSGGRLFS